LIFTNLVLAGRLVVNDFRTELKKNLTILPSVGDTRLQTDVVSMQGFRFYFVKNSWKQVIYWGRREIIVCLILDFKKSWKHTLWPQCRILCKR